jgi:hypothetical protein
MRTARGLGSVGVGAGGSREKSRDDNWEGGEGPGRGVGAPGAHHAAEPATFRVEGRGRPSVGAGGGEGRDELAEYSPSLTGPSLTPKPVRRRTR